MINKVSIEHREELKKLNEKFELKLSTYIVNEKEMKITIKDLQDKNV